MNVSFNGLRKNATNSMNELKSVLDDIIKLDSYDSVSIELKEDLIKKYNEAAMFVDTFNCLYDDNIEGDFDELINLEVDRLEDFQEEIDE
jgi:hypothetical protein